MNLQVSIRSVPIKDKELNLVNSTCLFLKIDLDSLCSAVVFAYLRSCVAPHIQHIPLSNLPQADLKLRTEMTAVLKHAGLNPSDLVTLSDLPDLEPEDTTWYLVDHNALTGPLRKYSQQVAGCVDHHVDEGAVRKDAKPRVIETTGSCMSLIIRETAKAWDDLSSQKMADDSSTQLEDRKLAMLALAPILIDTINLTEKNKVRPPDTEAVSYLQEKLQDPAFNSTKYWEEISAVKEDISDLSFHDIFRKDYKEWVDGGIKLGISCVVQNFDYLLEKADGSSQCLIDNFEAWVKEKDLDLASIMTTSHPNEEFQRHLLVWGVNGKGKAALDKFVEISSNLKLEPWGNGRLDEEKTRFTWRQHDLASSRKQVAPILRDAMNQVGSKSNI